MENSNMFLRSLFILSLVISSAIATDTNTTTADINLTKENNNSSIVDPNNLVKIEDRSGLTADEVRQVAKKLDKQAKQMLAHKVRWEDLSPTPIKDDWIQTKSGEWFKGRIKGLYDDKLEFDSDEIGLYTFDFDDIKRIKSYHMISVNVGNLASIVGILRLDGDKVTIIQGDNKYEFKREDIVSFAPNATLEKNFWSGKISFNLDMRSGNTNQVDYAAQANLKRRTAISNLSFDYLGRISLKDNEEIANDHRLNQKYDRYITRKFFWTPLFSEYYTDKYKNITYQITLGAGIGYTLFNTKKTLWSFSGGPALIYTKYTTVENGKDDGGYSPALELSTKFEKELSAITDFTYNYKLTFSDKNAGTYKHHMIFKFENKILSWLDVDITAIWDYVVNPKEDDNGVIPKNNDYQLLLGLGIEF